MRRKKRKNQEIGDDEFAKVTSSKRERKKISIQEIKKDQED